MKPGSPALFWKWNSVPVLSLSGNPFGAAAHIELLVRPMLAALTGCRLLQPSRRAVLQSAFAKASPNRRFVRGVCGSTGRPTQGLHAGGAFQYAGMRTAVGPARRQPAPGLGQSVDVVML